MRWKLLIFGMAVAGTLAGLTGCPPEFTPYYKVDKLRVLSIQADPVVAKHLEPVTLSALVYAPPGQDVTYEWSWCPIRPSAQNDYDCFAEADDLEGLFGAPPNGANGGEANGGENQGQDQEISEDIFDLGTEETATFVNPFTEEEVRDFCQAIQEQFIEATDDPELARFLPGGGCTQGYEVSLRLVVSTDDESIAATKRFTLWGGNEDYNENPEFADFEIRPAQGDLLAELRADADWDVPADASRDEQWQSMSADEPLTILSDMPFDIRSIVDEDTVQTYTPPPPRGQESEQPEPRTEALEYSYFLTLGGLSQSSGLYVDGQNTLETASQTQFSVDPQQLRDECQDPVDDGCRMHLWSVVRDNRLGADWISGELLVKERRQ